MILYEEKATVKNAYFVVFSYTVDGSLITAMLD